MKFKIKKDVLVSGIQAVQNVISSKSALPILSNVLLEAYQDSIRLTATDLDIGISCVLPVNTSEPGLITIPAKKLGEIVKELPSESISISTKKNNMVTIDTDTCQFKIVGLSSEEFPKLPEFKDREVIKIDQGVLKEMLNLTSFAVSFDETRYILNGILFKIEKGNINLVATDGKRLAVIDKKINQGTDKDIKTIVPIKTIHELIRNLKDDGELSLVINNNQALFDLGNIVIISRLIEGEFPDYKQVVPGVSENKMFVERAEFLLAVKRAALLSTPDYQAIKFEMFKDKLVVSKTTPDVGESREELRIEYKGKELVIGFNPNYLLDVLKNLKEEKICLEVSDSDKPAVVRVDGYTYVVLPMRLG